LIFRHSNEEKKVLEMDAQWEIVEMHNMDEDCLYRTKVPGGWLVIYRGKPERGVGSSITYVPDPKAEWTL
jgi:hypothetical protein